MDEFPIVDPHHHLYDYDSGNYPWLNADPPLPRIFGDYTSLKKNYFVEDFLADAKHQNVVKSVHVQMDYDHKHPVEETRWLQAIANQHGFPHGIVVYADLSSDAVEAVIEEHVAFANVRGVRQNLNWHDDPNKRFGDRRNDLTDAKWQSGYALLRKYDLSFDLQIYYTQMEDAYRLARKFPDTQIILDHAGMPIDRSPEGLQKWQRAMKRLSEAPNVACKISGLAATNFHWTTDSIRPDVLSAIDAFGITRCMFASNFPVDKLSSSYDAIFDAFKVITGDFSACERRNLFHDNAVRIYRI